VPAAAAGAPGSPMLAPGKQAPELPLPEGLVPYACSTASLEPTPRKQALEPPLPKGLVPPCLQQLLWLLGACACKQASELLLPTGFNLQ
jgi:hypothetical protein